ncbi:lactase-phlorizin hydrolase-like [Poecilia latipinna]|uniref:lactase-phlorizin hydrolase-like n=1 Tax=Poecilia latipinna TaxID=48699 RepID=UPI00072E7A41|nr:PREDICTED: lactase-phlorizin hydrolase-like [Poecilia latipinna]
MEKLLWLGCLYFLCILGSQGRGVKRQDDFVLLAGPLAQPELRTSSNGEHAAFDCSQPIPANSKLYFEYLRSKGVTHFKVPLSWVQLLPTGLSSKPQPGVVRCYQTLLKQLLEEGLQPLIILHGSDVPESLRSRYGGWESQWLLEMFQQYAEFALKEFGPLAQSWVTFSDLDEVLHAGQAAGDHHLQNILQLNKMIYQFYHHNFPGNGELFFFTKMTCTTVILT